MKKLEAVAIGLFVLLLGLELWLLICGIWRWDGGYLDWRGLLFTLGFALVTGWLLWRNRKRRPHIYSDSEYKEYLRSIEDVDREEQEFLAEVWKGIREEERDKLQSGTFKSGDQV